MPEQPQQQMNPEQVEELQEKIKNMSPEELKEFQKKQCIFCHIVEGKVQSKKIYEDDKCVAILDINPANPGHVLLLPKEHYSIMPQVPEEELSHLFMITKTISNATLRSLGVQGTNIIVQNGVAAGQKAQHFMIHIIPRKENDDLNFELPQKEIPEAELEAIRKKLETKLGEVKSHKSKISEGLGTKFQSGAPKKPKVQDLIKPKVVEAEFKEDTGEKPAKKKENKKEEPKTSKKKKESPSKKNKEQSSETPNLDDIARILGAK